MNRDTYHTLFGSVPDQNTLYVKMDSWDSITDDYLTAVTDINGVENVSFHNTILDNFNKMVSGINGVVIVLVISSMALAFVVLGNLTNVNISERLREIATLKVLGFREREVQNYIYKENNILVAFGAFVGLPVGILLHGYIMREVELTNVMYGRSADFTTFIYSIGLTILFGLMVNFFMRRKLDNILMVESLKSVE